MIEYRCPTDGRLLFKAAGPLPVVVEAKCGKCKRLVQPVGRAGTVMQRTYRCETCHRTQHVERPKNERTYCIVCGTPSLVIIAQLPALEPNSAPRATGGARHG